MRTTISFLKQNNHPSVITEVASSHSLHTHCEKLKKAPIQCLYILASFEYFLKTFKCSVTSVLLLKLLPYNGKIWQGETLANLLFPSIWWKTFGK